MKQLDKDNYISRANVGGQHMQYLSRAGGTRVPKLDCGSGQAYDTSNSTADGLSDDRKGSSHGSSLCTREITSSGNITDPRLNPSGERAQYPTTKKCGGGGKKARRDGTVV